MNTNQKSEQIGTGNQQKSEKPVFTEQQILAKMDSKKTKVGQTLVNQTGLTETELRAQAIVLLQEEQLQTAAAA
jgi:hypothetical protein